MLKVSEFSATAPGSSDRGTIPGTRLCRAGCAKACEQPTRTSSTAIYSYRMVPVSVRVARVNACAAVMSCVITVNRSRSTRSETAPANGEINTDGARLQNASTATQSAECVSSQASQSTATFCTHNPVQDPRLQP